MPRVREVPYPYQQIAEHYRKQVRDLKLKPGERFPSIADIARDWDVATATAQRVINLLRKEGWVVTEHGRATFVAANPPP